MLNDLLTLTLLLACWSAAWLICLGKWKVIAWLEFNYWPNICLFCLGFWLAVIGFLLVLPFIPFTWFLSPAPFLAAPVTRFIIGSIK